ncbi:MAG: S8 family serine peptidase [bacterium]
MKRFFLVLVLLAVFSSLYGEKVYRKDGSFFEIQRNEGIFAMKVKPGLLKAPDNYLMQWSFQDEFVVISKDKVGNMPVYLAGAHIIVADSSLFYDGSKPLEFIADKYDLTLLEILPDYGLVEFASNGDTVQIAEKIVENGDGFAFANIIRKMEYKTNPVKFPINDKYYKEGYQWSLNNTGKGIDPYNKKIDTLKNADIRFEKAIEFVYNAIENGELENFEVAKVAIMDSGVDMEHPDLKNKLDAGWNMVHKREGGDPGEIKSGGMYGTAGYSHGTNCAGVAAAEGNDIGVAGVCPWCGIYPVTYMEGGSGAGVDEKQLLVVYQKYVDDPAISAINCSFGPMAGMGKIPVTNGEIESHTNFLENGRNGLGGAIVYASGNDGVDASYYQLLDYKFSVKRNGETTETKVISVGATSAWDTRVAYSNFSPTLDIVAPSLSMNPILGIATSYLVGYGDLDNDYSNQFSGTSASAPVVTGFFGTIFSVNPELTLEDAIQILYESADKINPETGFWDKKGHSVKFGYGRVNLHKAVRLAAGLSACEEEGDEVENDLDDNCDGFVDEGFTKDFSKVGAKCEASSDCANADFDESVVECLKGEFKAFNFKDGFCTIKNNKFSCPDGTAQYSDSQTERNCFLECNIENKCPDGFSCSDNVLGKCFPKCKNDTDCSKDAYCNDDGQCKNNPSEPGGECESDEDCKYNAMCISQIPGGFCMLMCSNDSQCGDDAKCVKIEFGDEGAYNICLPSCEEDGDCRNFGGMMQMKCHERYDEKEDVCNMPCRQNSDCFDIDAECVDSRCVSAGDTKNDDDDKEENDTETADDDQSLEDDIVPDDNKSKKSKGCSVVTI